MGYLLKEVLKTLCGVNQWSYSVFWKIGCQNPKLLIWEEYYHEPTSYSGLQESAGNGTLENAFHKYNAQVNDRVHLLVNKMMMNNHVIVVGEGLVGRVAFTGNHQWIPSETFYSQTHPPEVQKEVCQQFSDGMQTVAVIPVLPHGVLQFGSFLKIMENVGFVNQVTSLIVHLGYVSGIFLSEDYAAKGLLPRIGVPVYLQSSTPGTLSLESSFAVTPCSLDDLNCIGPTSVCQSQALLSGVQNELLLDGAPFQSSSSTSFRHQNHDHDVEIAREVKVNCSPSNQKVSRLVKADVIPTNSELWKKQHSGRDVSGSTLDIPSSSSLILNHGSMRFREQEMLPETGNHDPFSIPSFSGGFQMPTTKTNSGLLYCSNDGYVTRAPVEENGLSDGCHEKFNADEQNILNLTTSAEIKREASNSTPFDKSKVNTFLAHCIGSKHQNMDHKLVLSELKACKGGIARTPPPQKGDHLTVPEHIPGFHEVINNTMFEGHISSGNISKHDNAYAHPESGDDLFDVLGADLKNKLISGCWNSSPSNESTVNMQGFASSLLAKQIVDSGILQSSETDHLLDAMVSKQISAKSIMDDGTSCQATLMNMTISSAPDPSRPYSQLTMASENPKDELFGVPKYVTNAEAASSMYGSRFSSWVGDSKDSKMSESVSTRSSKKPDETSKPTRKRFKPGENPKPRPKDRQMIQDRVKELREIVPNAAKCSIDALLERTIKHMLFLQSVTKHADKLRQTGESKIISKDGGLLLRDNLEGGATWAYEVGSQSMVYPIIVEVLHQPGQMLVEMICEERGSFLEIADVIRGLGLTILNGIMETRNDKIWVRFAVEANRDITRMEIFISLVHLLEQGAASGVTQPNDISNKNKHDGKTVATSCLCSSVW